MSVLPQPDFGLLGQDGCVIRPDWLQRRLRRACSHPGFTEAVNDQYCRSYECAICGEKWERRYETLILADP